MKRVEMPMNCPKCGKKSEIAGSYQTRNELVKHYRCLKCGILFQDAYEIVYKGKKVCINDF